MLWEESSKPDYGSFMRNSMAATADLLNSIEKDIQESRQMIQAKNNDGQSLSKLVAVLQEDNSILKVNELFWLAFKLNRCIVTW